MNSKERAMMMANEVVRSVDVLLDAIIRVNSSDADRSTVVELLKLYLKTVKVSRSAQNAMHDDLEGEITELLDSASDEKVLLSYLLKESREMTAAFSEGFVVHRDAAREVRDRLRN